MSRLKKRIRNFQFFIEYRTVSKKTILVHEGEMCNFEVIKGCVGNIILMLVLQFAIENAWVSDISFSIYETK
jgi:hypothetical protein